MKKLIIIIVLLVLALITFLSFKINRLKHELSNKTSILDSIAYISKIAPKVTIKDTVIYKESIRWRTKFDTIQVVDSLKLKMYNDSIVNDSINLHVKVSAIRLSSIDYIYKPIIYNREIIKEVKVPFLIEKNSDKICKTRNTFLTLGLSSGLSPAVGVRYKRASLITTYSQRFFSMYFLFDL